MASGRRCSGRPGRPAASRPRSRRLVRPLPGGVFGPDRVNVAVQRREPGLAAALHDAAGPPPPRDARVRLGRQHADRERAARAVRPPLRLAGLDRVRRSTTSPTRRSTASSTSASDVDGVDDLLELREHQVEGGRLRVELDAYGYLWLRAIRSGAGEAPRRAASAAAAASARLCVVEPQLAASAPCALSSNGAVRARDRRAAARTGCRGASAGSIGCVRLLRARCSSGRGSGPSGRTRPARRGSCRRSGGRPTARAAGARPPTRSPARRPRAGRSAARAADAGAAGCAPSRTAGVFTPGSWTSATLTFEPSCSSSARSESSTPLTACLEPQ